MKETLLISFSGGRTSAMMTKYLLDNYQDIYSMVVVFSNTGHERQATLDFVNKCDNKFNFNTIWIEPEITASGTKAKIVDYETAYTNRKKNGLDPFEQMIIKYGIPNIMNPHCSRELKARTIRAFMRDYLKHKKIDYKTAIGFRSDEPKRLNWEKAKKNKLIYLAQLGKVTKEDVNKFWIGQEFDLELKSYQGNCILCWKKSDRKLFTIIREGILSNDLELLAEIEWIESIHRKYGNYVKKERAEKQGQVETKMFRDNRDMVQMIEESKYLSIVEFAKDESHIIDTSLQLTMFNDSLDMSGGCHESCEPF